MGEGWSGKAWSEEEKERSRGVRGPKKEKGVERGKETGCEREEDDH